jgi:RNase H-fold protein (predicted Holliday junction resolvase)
MPELPSTTEYVQNMAPAQLYLAHTAAIYVALQYQTFLALDFGLKRTGFAVGNRLLRWQPDALVVGVPFHPDGASHDNTAARAAFCTSVARSLQVAGV